MNQAQKKMKEHLEETKRFDFSLCEDILMQSPEDRQERL